MQTFKEKEHRASSKFYWFLHKKFTNKNLQIKFWKTDTKCLMLTVIVLGKIIY